MTTVLPPALADWLKGKTYKDFEIIEHLGGRLLWPTSLFRLKADKQFHEEKVYLQVLDPIDIMEATVKAQQIFDARGLNAQDERHKPIWGEIEAYAQVSIAMRSSKAHADGNYPPLHNLEILLSAQLTGISRSQVLGLHGQLRVFEKFEDPRLEKLTTEQVVAANLAIAEVGNCSPLVPIVGSELDEFAISTACLLKRYLLHEQSSPSPTNSKTGRSRSKN